MHPYILCNSEFASAICILSSQFYCFCMQYTFARIYQKFELTLSKITCSQDNDLFNQKRACHLSKIYLYYFQESKYYLETNTSIKFFAHKDYKINIFFTNDNIQLTFRRSCMYKLFVHFFVTVKFYVKLSSNLKLEVLIWNISSRDNFFSCRLPQSFKNCKKGNFNEGAILFLTIIIHESGLSV